MILDLRLPEVPGSDVCREIKKKAPALPVIVLSAKTDVADKVLLLELGADDYVTKPFSPREVVLRLKAIERRRSEKIEDERLVCGPIALDPVRHHVDVAGKAVRLTSAEFKLLNMLMKKPGRVYSREMLLSGAWGYEAVINTRTVDTHIRRLRDKLGRAANTIETVRGYGYRLLAE